MKALRLVLITSVCLLMALSASAQVKIGDDELERGIDHWLEIKRSDTLFIVTDKLELGRTDDPHTLNPHNPGADAIMLKLYGYGLGTFFPTNIGGTPYFQDTVSIGGITSNIFAGFTNDGQILEVPLKMVLKIQDSTVADLSFFNGIDTFGTANLMLLDSIFATDNQTFYLSDGTLDEDRTVNGDGNTLTFNNLDSAEIDAGFITIDGDQVAIQQDGQDIIQINALEQIKVRSSTRDSILFIDTTGIMKASYYGDISNANPNFSTLVGMLPDGTIIDVDVNDILGAQEDSTIYTHNGTLTMDRTLTGATLDLTFSDIGAFQVTGDSVDIDATNVDFDGTEFTADYTGSITSAAGSVHATSGASVNVTAISGDITLNSTTSNEVVITSDSTLLTGEFKLENYGDSLITGAHVNILGVDDDGNVIEVDVNDILGAQIDSTIYNSDGTLDENRKLNGGNFNLTFGGINALQDSSTTSLSTTTGLNTVESTGGNVEINATTADIDANATNVDVDATGTSTVTSGGDNTVESTAGNVVINATTADIDANATNVDVDATGTSTVTSGGDNTVESTAGNVVINATTADIDANATNVDVDATGTSTITSGGDNTVESTGGDVILNSTTSNEVVITSDSTLLTGEFKLENYGDSLITGAHVNILGVDDDGNVIEVDVNDILGAQIDSTIYNSDGTLDENRKLNGGNFNLTFGGINALQDSSTTSLSTTTGLNTVESTGGNVEINATTADIDANATNVDVDATGTSTVTSGGDNTVESTAGNVVINATTADIDANATNVDVDATGTSTVTSGGDNTVESTAGNVVINATTADIDANATNVDVDATGTSTITSGGDNTVESTGGDVILNSTTSNEVVITSDSTLLTGEFKLENYGDSLITGAHVNILGVDDDGNVIEVDVNDILGAQIDSTIYNSDGTLDENRKLNGGNFNLTFGGINALQDSSTTSLSTTTGLNTVESTGGNVVINATTADIDANATNVDVDATGTSTVTSGGDNTVESTAGNVVINATTADIDANATNVDVDATGTSTVTSGGDNTVESTAGNVVINATTADIDANATNVDVDATGTSTITSGGDNTVESTGGDVILNSTTSNEVVITSDSTLLTGEFKLENYGDSLITGAHVNILGVDDDGNVIEVDVNDILGAQIDSTIYNSDGTLDENRKLNGGNFNLTFGGINALQDSSTTSLSTTTGLNTVESTGGNVEINATTADIDANATNVDVDATGTSTVTSGGDNTVESTAGNVVINATTADIDANATNVDVDATGTSTVTSGGDNTVESTAGNVVINATTADIDANATNVDVDATGTSTITSGGDNTVESTGGDVILNSTTSNEVVITSDSTLLTGEFKLENYGDSLITGAHVNILGVDDDGNVIEVDVNDILGAQIDSTIYNSDGTLDENRKLNGGNFNLTFGGINALQDSSTTSLSTTTGVNTTESTGGDVVINASTGTMDINTPDVILSDTLNMESYGSDNIKGTFTTILAADAAGKVIELTADEILGTQTDSVIYRHNGTLTSQRYMTMATYDLHFIDGTDTSVITSDGRMALGRGTVTQGTGTANDIRLDVNGDILAIQVHSSSDERFKKDIVNVDHALAKVKAINGVTYNFRTDEFKDRNFPTTSQLGFIAQNVELVIPEVVKTDAKGYKSIDYAKLTALLNEAIKEQQAQIDILSKQLKSANQQNAHLADEIASIKEMIRGISNLAVSDED